MSDQKTRLGGYATPKPPRHLSTLPVSGISRADVPKPDDGGAVDGLVNVSA